MPRETLTREQIVWAAIEVLDSEGLEGLNMRALGKRLNCAATAVYWHVHSKDNLVVLAGDEVWSEIELPDLDQADWRTAATAMAHGLHAMINRHLWLVPAMGTHLIYGPRKARHDDHCLKLYEAAGFSGRDADWALNTVFMFVLGRALGESAELAGHRRLGRSTADEQQQMRDSMEEITKIAMQFSTMRARMTDWDNEAEGTADSGFEYGLQTILDGLAVRLTGRGTPVAHKAGVTHEA